MDFSWYLLICAIIIGAVGVLYSTIIPITEIFASIQQAGDEKEQLDKYRRARGMYFANCFYRAIGVACLGMAAACISVMGSPSMYGYLAIAYLGVYPMIELAFSAVCQSSIMGTLSAMLSGGIFGVVIVALVFIPWVDNFSWATALVFCCILVATTAVRVLLSGTVSKGTRVQRVTAFLMVVTYVLLSAAILITTILPYEKNEYSTINYAYTQPWLVLLFAGVWGFLGFLSFVCWSPITTVVHPSKEKST